MTSHPSSAQPAPTVAGVQAKHAELRPEVAKQEAQLERLRRQQAERADDEGALAEAERTVKALRNRLGR